MMITKNENVIYDLSKADDINKFQKHKKTWFSYVEDYLVNGNYNATYEKNIVLTSDMCVLMKINNCLCDTGILSSYAKENPLTSLKGFVSRIKTIFLKNKSKDSGDIARNISGIFISCKKNKANKKLKHMLLLCGDADEDDTDNLVFLLEKFELPTVSFACMGNFYKNEREFIERVIKEKTKILDYRPAETIALTSEDRKILKRTYDNRPSPPKPGFSIISNSRGQNIWHRSGNVLFYDEEKDMCVLAGQDEGSYFGVELPKKCNTVSEAFECLIPSEVKGKKYLRQGEWFMIKVDENKIPKLTDCIAYSYYGYSSNISLPVETKDSNPHEVEANEIRISKDGVYALDPYVEHAQHEKISGKGWFTFYKNTALRSFSQQGVD